MTDTMNKSKLRGNPDGGSGSIVITAGSEGRGQRAEGRGQRADGRGQRADSRQQTADSRLRQQTQTADSDSRLRQQTQTADSDSDLGSDSDTKKAARHHCPAADKIKRN